MRTDKKLWRNRKAKKELARRLQSDNLGLEVVHAHACELRSYPSHRTEFFSSRLLQPQQASGLRVGLIEDRLNATDNACRHRRHT
jgi:hypothetical protein